jgi:hypothetical protein
MDLNWLATQIRAARDCGIPVTAEDIADALEKGGSDETIVLNMRQSAMRFLDHPEQNAIALGRRVAKYSSINF